MRSARKTSALLFHAGRRLGSANYFLSASVKLAGFNSLELNATAAKLALPWKAFALFPIAIQPMSNP
jgi:hypothetical protein